MPNDNDKQRIADLEALNAKLASSLDRCRDILRECRNRLSANENAEDATWEASDERDLRST